eukprot:765468-Hanusia_phi.AAC.1
MNEQLLSDETRMQSGCRAASSQHSLEGRDERKHLAQGSAWRNSLNLRNFKANRIGLNLSVREDF